MLGLDADQWFNNVEFVTAEKIGVETTTYVRNVFKYYVGYTLTEESENSSGRHAHRLRRGCTT